MRTQVIVFFDVPPDVFFGISRGFIILEINLVVFQGSPEALKRNIVGGMPLSVHTDFNARRFQNTDPFQIRKLSNLIRVEYLRPAVMTQRFLQGVKAEKKTGEYYLGCVCIA